MDDCGGSFVPERRLSQEPEQSCSCHSSSGPLPDMSGSRQPQPESPITTVERECAGEVHVGPCLDEDMEDRFSSNDEMEENLVAMDPTSENLLEGECGMDDSMGRNEMEGKSKIAVEGDVDIVPIVGMEFESIIEAHNFYNHYANNIGFATKKKRTNSSKINGLIHVLFTCVKEGFKQADREAKKPRPPTREGCNARMRIKLMPSKKWRVTEVITMHSHIVSPLFITKHTPAGSPSKSSFNKSHTVIPIYKTRKILPKMLPYIDSTVHNSALMGLLYPEVGGDENLTAVETDVQNFIDLQRRMSHARGDAQSIFNFFTHMQTKNSDFFYAIDVDKDGHLRNVFWADARANAAYGYFGDVVTFDTTYLTNRYDIPLALFVGMNHHWQPVLLGCGFVANETKESFCWLFRTWAAAMSGRHPSTIITNQCRTIQAAVAEVFPNTRHCLSLWGLVKTFKEKLGSLSNCKEVTRGLKDCIYDSLTVDEFEKGWVKVITDYDLLNNEWLQMLYGIREQWVPVYLKGTFLAGMPTLQRNMSICAFFDGYVHSKTCFKEFVQNYNLALRNHYEKEAQADFESFHTTPTLKTDCQFESQAASIYTRDIFYKFQDEICGMCNCTVRCSSPDGPVVMYTVKEHHPSNGCQKKQPRNYEVSFDISGTKVSCICRLFEYHGILCRHALCVLRDSDVENIPPHYFLPRWTKNFKRKHVPGQDRATIQDGDVVQRFDDLYRRTMEIAEKGSISQGTYEAALLAIEEALRKISLVDEVVGNIDGVRADKSVASAHASKGHFYPATSLPARQWGTPEGFANVLRRFGGLQR